MGHRRPVGAGPAWAFGFRLNVHLGISERAKERAPRVVNRVRIGGILAIELLQILGVMALHEGGGVELVVGRLVGHDAPMRSSVWSARFWLVALRKAAAQNTPLLLSLLICRSLRSRLRQGLLGFQPQRYRLCAWLRSCLPRRPCRQRRLRQRGPYDGREGLCGPR